MNKNKKTISIVSYIVGIVLLLFLTSLLLDMSKEEVTKLKYYEVLEMFENDQIESYTLDLGTGALEAQVKDQKEKLIYTVPNVSVFLDDVDRILEAKGESAAALKPDYLPIKQTPWWVSMLPTLLLIGAMVVFWFFMMRQNGGAGSAMTFGKANYRTGKNEKPTTFADVAGCKEEKEELEEIVDFLKHPNQFNALGARIPKGVLLVGQPGTGKTLLARAVAGEAGVPFFSISGSDFVEMFVGVGASRVRDLFGEAKKNAPSIVFIDEIDAVGRHRGAGLGGGHDEREQTLNQLLVEMDGFGNNTGIIVMAATNRPDILDPALLRPGRFDRQITIGAPDIEGREAILKIHTKNKPLAPDVDLSVIAKSTAGFTGAELENLVNEAALLAARRKKRAITMAEIEEATIKVVAGPEKRSHKTSEKDRRLTSYHEAGHAVVTYFCPTQDPVHEISTIPRGYAGGYIQRIDMQHELLMAVATQMLSLKNIPNLSEVISIVTDNMKTSLSTEDMLYYAKEFLKLDKDNIKFMTMPGDTNGSVFGSSYVFCDIDAWLDMVNEYLNPWETDVTCNNVDIVTYKNGNFYSTTGELKGGVSSFLNYSSSSAMGSATVYPYTGSTTSNTDSKDDNR